AARDFTCAPVTFMLAKYRTGIAVAPLWRGVTMEKPFDDLNETDQPLDDPLGIAHVPIAKSPNDPHATNDPEEVARRRARARGENDGEFKSDLGELNEDGFGATSIDMGYGGAGNAVKKSRRR